MPGKHLNNTEEKLLNMWNSNKIGYLKAVCIKNGTPVRGISDCKVEFNYPITVFCGKNGSGKTTFLQLTALAFHNTERVFRKTFSDFFRKSKYDSSNDGTILSWLYKGTFLSKYSKSSKKEFSEISIHKGNKKWMHYDRRPYKKVVFLPVSRVIPSNEKHYKNADELTEKSFSNLTQEYRKYLCDIMQRKYDIVSEYKGLFSKCKQNGNEYSCWNMGIGERILIYILSEMQEADEESLIVIDEIEMGLHPQALSKLAMILQEVSLKKRLQIFITSHSKDFIDALPREARILIQRSENRIDVINGPTTTYALSKMSDMRNVEVVVYCEDNIAETIIKECLGTRRSRIQFATIGAKTELMKAIKIHLENGDKRKCVVIWDGDVSQIEAVNLIKDSALTNNFSAIKLPGDEAPEKWIMQSLDCEEGKYNLAKSLNISKEEAASIIEEEKIERECHNIFYSVSKKIGDSEKDIINSFCRAAVETKKDDFKEINEVIDALLDGNFLNCFEK